MGDSAAEANGTAQAFLEDGGPPSIAADPCLGQTVTPVAARYVPKTKMGHRRVTHSVICLAADQSLPLTRKEKKGGTPCN